MKTFLVFIITVFSLALSGVVAAGDGGETSVPVEPDGIFTITPVLDQSCIAVKIPLNVVQALAGVRWYNNDDQIPFAKLLVASGRDAVPPLYSDGVVVAENVYGERVGWSELVFDESYGSQSEALYLIFQFPEDTEGSAEADGPGIGYREDNSASCIFLSAEGEDWVRLQTGFSLLVEPIIVARELGAVALSMSLPVQESSAEQEIPKVTALIQPFPNPFNPLTNIKFTLSKPGVVDINVYDLRGRLITSLAQGHHVAGRYMVQWSGDDKRGSTVASGVYFVRMETEDLDFSKRVVLLK